MEKSRHPKLAHTHQTRRMRYFSAGVLLFLTSLLTWWLFKPSLDELATIKTGPQPPAFVVSPTEYHPSYHKILTQIPKRNRSLYHQRHNQNQNQNRNRNRNRNPVSSPSERPSRKVFRRSTRI